MTDRLERIVGVVLLALAAIVFFAEARSVFVAPQPNSVRWFGDETWLMLEAKQHITTGVLSYPLALGTSLTEHKGLLLGVSWLSSGLYGIPVALSAAEPVDVGRMVSLILAAIAATALFGCARVLGARMWIAALSVVMLVANRSFLFTSHSARPDMLAGLVVMLVFSVGLRWLEIGRRFSPQQSLILGVATVFIMLSSSIHLLTLVGPLALFFAIRIGVFSTARSAFAFISGALLILAVLAGVYYGTTGTLALLGEHGTHVQFGDVLTSIPILRPFSRSVQIANIVIRAKQVWAEAPQALIVLPLALVALIVARPAVTSLVAAFTAVFLSWLLLQGAEVHYLMHIVPVMILVAAVLWTRIVTPRAEIEALTAVILAGVLTILTIRDSNSALAEGTRIARSNDRAVGGVFAAVAEDWQRPGLPVIVTEPAALEGLLKYPVCLSTDHFISFPKYDLPIDSYLDTIGVDYVVLYNSTAYPKNRPASDPFYQAVRARGQLVDLETGTIGDFGRDYFTRSNFRDTLLVFRWSHASHWTRYTR